MTNINIIKKLILQLFDMSFFVALYFTIYLINKNLSDNTNTTPIKRIVGNCGRVLLRTEVIITSYPTINDKTKITKKFSNLIFNIIPFY